MASGIGAPLVLATVVCAAWALGTLQPRVAASPADEEGEETWWSLAPLQPVAVPEVDAEHRGRVRNGIDAFVLARLEELGIEPSPPADRRTLLRRLSVDLVGLPPTPEELEAFLADELADAYERQVERLLASPRYGERWGRHWLDVVHYADTHGYDKDKRRPNAWPYRDYVIRSFNEDKPYGRFVEEQLAGDRIDPTGAEGITATGFIVAGPWDFVGHVELGEGTLDKKIVRNLDRDDMVTTTMSTFTSLTVHCARCHDHKFDPITQPDYYGLQAVFAGVERAERNYDPDPARAARRAELTAREGRLEAQRAELVVRVESLTGPRVAELDRELEAARTLRQAMARNAPGVHTLGYHSAIEPSPQRTKWVQVDLGSPRAIEAVHLVGAHVVYGPHDGPGFGFVPRFRVQVSNDPEFADGVLPVADWTGMDFPHPGDAPRAFPVESPLVGRYVRVTATRLWERTEDFIFALGEVAVVSEGTNVALGKPVRALDTIEAEGSWGLAYLVDGVFGQSSFAELEALRTAGASEASSDPFHGFARLRTLEHDVERLDGELEAARLKLADESTRRALSTTGESLARVHAELAELEAPRRVYAATPVATGPRPIHLLRRGSESDPDVEVAPHAVAAVPGPDPTFDLTDPADEGARRLALARWITHRDNPLTWRSIANRVWHHHFGRGLVATPNDFGRMGERPTHPKLLDWLALGIRGDGQSIKDLHRLIVTSATYRQVSAGRPEGERVDAENRFLWRMNRRRLDADAIRDAMLAVSGELDTTMAGPGFDVFAFEDDESPRYLYDRHDPDDPASLRRSVYRFVVRSVPDPFMEVFDCADPSVSVPVRGETITAPQALALLNDPFVLRRAERLAQRVSAVQADLASRIVAAWTLALSRSPTPTELAHAHTHAEQHGLPALCRVLLNTSEFVFID